MPGPLPKPPEQRRHRNKTTLATALVKLPSEGRRGRPPRWPIGKSAPEDVRPLWRALWATPQAVAWESMGWTRVVARYALLVLEAERPDAEPARLTEARQLEDRLGLTPMAMLRLRWQIAPADPVEPAVLSSLDDYRAALTS